MTGIYFCYFTIEENKGGGPIKLNIMKWMKLIIYREG
jgi:hypothetical protein